MIKRNLFDSLESAYNLKYKNRQSLIQNIIYISRFTIVTYIYNKIIDKNINKVLIIDYNKIVEADKYEINKLEKYN